MRIKTITVKKLFGIFDYTIPLNIDDRITIIHAPNGFGKTITLSMIYGLFNGRYEIFRSIPFESFIVDFDDGTCVWVDKENDATRQDSLVDKSKDSELHQDIKQKSSKITLNISGNDDSKSKSISLDLLSINSTSKEKYLNGAKTLPLEFQTVDGTYTIQYHDLNKNNQFDLGEPFWLTPLPYEYKIPDWLQKLINIQFIQTQRLYGFITESSSLYERRNVAAISVVEQYAQDLIDKINQKLAEFAILSQYLERTYPSRLVKQMGQNHSNLTTEQIIEELNKLEKKRSELMEIGLLDKSKDEAFSLPETTNEQTKGFLSVYVQDVKEKQKIFDEIANKIKLFKNIITKRFQYKEIIISKEKGFHFVSSDGNPLPLNALSSGEQHELVMLYQLLFKTKPDSLILIDEPEISLHVAWQREFLEEISEIVKLAELDIILATHSPSIINDRWDLTVRLKEPNSK